MPRGGNPRSWGNRKLLGQVEGVKVNLRSHEREYLIAIGAGNLSGGCREAARFMERISKKLWGQAAEVLGCESSPRAIAEAMRRVFPGIEKGSKNHLDLIQELGLGEAALEKCDDRIVRVVALVVVQISHQGKELVESYQIFKGERMERNIVGVSEKIQYGESPEDAARRGLKEELQVVPKQIQLIGMERSPNRFSKYRGIASYANKYTFKATLFPEDIREEYREVSEDKVTVFSWR